MTLDEWEWFEDFATNPLYTNDNGLRLWCWTGTYPTPFMRNWLPNGRGLEQELQFIGFTQINHMFRQRGWVQPVDRRHVHRALNLFRSEPENVLVDLIRGVQREAEDVLDLVNTLDEPERGQMVADLGPPSYILREMMREAAIKKVTQMCDNFATNADTEI